MITTIWNVMDCELESTASVVNGLIELLGDDGRESQEKKDEVLESWKTFELEVRYPSFFRLGYRTATEYSFSSNAVSSRSSYPQLLDLVMQV